jgi:hypothetical protein
MDDQVLIMTTMIHRPFWINRILASWQSAHIVWVSGVRRSGKTTLARMLPDTVFLNCDLPSVRRALHDPEAFFRGVPPDGTVVLDEVHRLEDPSAALKIAADEFPRLRILATGSSTLAATRKFRDALTGRKRLVHLTPVLWRECLDEFGIANLDHRLLRGGLPEPLMAQAKDASFFSEWIDSFYARDIGELFGIRNRVGFSALLELLMRQSGGLLDVTKLSRECALSRPTVGVYLEAMRLAHAGLPVRPFHGGGRREITRQPKWYAFDTGFVTFVRGWDTVREEDRGLLWEHLVLEALRAAQGDRDLFFWRDKSGREIDFVIRTGGDSVDAIECKVSPEAADWRSLPVFREHYPHGRNYVVSPHVPIPFTSSRGDLHVNHVALDGLPHARAKGDAIPDA